MQKNKQGTTVFLVNAQYKADSGMSVEVYLPCPQTQNWHACAVIQLYGPGHL